jgi:hypothetical protein
LSKPSEWVMQHAKPVEVAPNVVRMPDPYVVAILEYLDHAHGEAVPKGEAVEVERIEVSRGRLAGRRAVSGIGSQDNLSADPTIIRAAEGVVLEPGSTWQSVGEGNVLVLAVLSGRVAYRWETGVTGDETIESFRQIFAWVSDPQPEVAK